MLIGNTVPRQLLIRTTILGFRSIAPLSIIYTAILLTFPEQAPRWPASTFWKLYICSEAFFYLVVYLPLKQFLQKDATHPVAPDKATREKLFQKCLEHTHYEEHYLSGWFLHDPKQDIRRENLKELFAWAFLNKRLEDIDIHESSELEDYALRTQTHQETDYPSGVGAVSSLRGTLDPVPMQHRPLLWYAIVLLADLYTSTRLWNASFSLRSQSPANALCMLPPRPHTLLANQASPTPNVPYWFREHTSKTRLPIVFIHGIGIGLLAYKKFLVEMASQCSRATDASGGTVGIIALELMSISSRICAPAPETAVLRREIAAILDSHGWNEFVLVSHSYGTAIASNVVRDPSFANRVKGIALLDPVSFLLHLPDVAFNFTRRKPTKANEHMLHYFASQDALISDTLARHFFWNEYILWKEDIANIPAMVLLSGQDLIVPSKAVWNYLTDYAEIGPRDNGDGGAVEYRRDRLRVLYFDSFDHASALGVKSASAMLAKAVLDLTSAQKVETD